MPYPRAHYVLLALVPIIVLAFWPFYFSRLSANPWTMHVHGVTASLWILLLIAQSWSIHHHRIALHRAAGQGSLVLFPLFMAGGFLVLFTMAVGLATQANPFVVLYGGGLGLVDTLALGTFAWLYYSALKQRRQVQLHARYLLATPLLLLMPIFTRLFLLVVPGLSIRGVEDLPRFVPAFHLSAAMAFFIALALYRGNRRYGRPFLVVALITLVQAAGFQWIGPADWWHAVLSSLAMVPVWLVFAASLASGGAIAWLGWQGGLPARPRRPLPQPAS